MKNAFKIIFLMFIFYSCQSEHSFKECIHGKPKPFFKESDQDIAKYSFKIRINESNELIHFKNGIILNIKQSGCQNFTQQLEFSIPAEPYKFYDDLDWKKLIIQLLYNYGSRDKDLIAFQSWANLLETKIDLLNGVTQIEIFDGFYASLKFLEDEPLKRIILTISEENNF
jgi:hypothetical protein